jgi:RecA/RadA recombinase
MSGAAAYLSCGEGEFPFKRLQQLASEFEAIHSIPSSQLLSNIHIENCHNSEIIQESLLHRVPALCRNENLKLLIIDSLAGIVRFEFQAKDMIVARSEYLFKIAQQLKWLADTYKLVIVVVNQVTANFDSALSSSASSAGATSSNPALGLSWSHCISSRIRLYRNRSAFINVNENVSEKQSPRDDKDEISDNKFNSVKSTTSSSTLPSSYTRRLMSLEMSPCRALNQCFFEVRQGGVFGVES